VKLALRLGLSFLYLSVACVWAQEQSSAAESSCSSTLVASVPSRPTVSNSTDTTQCGVVELEYGWERQWVSPGVHQNDLSGGLRLGLTPNLDFHWASADFLSMVDPTGARSGFGDTWLGLKYRFLRQTDHAPSLGVFYVAKVPSADDKNGMGTGRVDHAISFLASKDIGRVHIDFNVTQLLAGCQATDGFDHNTGLALSSSIPLTKRLGLVTEGYGYTSLNRDKPAFASTTVGFTYQVQRRLILDSGIDIGVTSDAPQTRVFAGITYAIGNAYSWLRPNK